MTRVTDTRYHTRERKLKLGKPGDRRPGLRDEGRFWLTRGLAPVQWKLRWWRFRNPWMPWLLAAAIALGLVGGFFAYGHLPPGEVLSDLLWGRSTPPTTILRGGHSHSYLFRY